MVIFVIMSLAWVGLLLWFGDNIQKENYEAAALALAGSVIASSLLVFLTRHSIPRDRSPIVVRLVDFAVTLSLNLIAAVIAIIFMGKI